MNKYEYNNKPESFRNMDDRWNLKRLADSNENIAKETQQIANEAKTIAELAMKKAKQADIKGWISLLLSAITIAIEFIAHHEEIINYFL